MCPRLQLHHEAMCLFGLAPRTSVSGFDCTSLSHLSRQAYFSPSSLGKSQLELSFGISSGYSEHSKSPKLLLDNFVVLLSLVLLVDLGNHLMVSLVGLLMVEDPPGSICLLSIAEYGMSGLSWIGKRVIYHLVEEYTVFTTKSWCLFS